MKHLDKILKYLSERPLFMKTMDVILIIVLAITLSTVYVITINFKDLFLSKAEAEYSTFIQAVESNQYINNLLTALLDETGSARVGIFQFHNGTMGMGDLPFFYYSQTFEKVRPGVSSEISNSKSISLSMDPGIAVLKDSLSDFNNSIDITTPLGHYFAKKGTRQYYRHAIYTIRGRFAGFLMIEFSDTREINEAEMQNILTRYSNAITGLIS